MSEYQMPGPKVLLMGDSGTGKTHSIRTLIDAGITPFIIFTEPGMEVLSDIPAEKCHWAYVKPVASSWEAQRKVAELVNRMNFDSLVKMQDTNKNKYTQFLDVIDLCNNFRCQRTGEEFGDAATWGNDRALVIDSLTGLSSMAMNLATGGKVAKQMQDWMISQNLVRNFVNQLTTGLDCWFCMTAHLDKERDEVTGAYQIMVKTLGQKLAPEIPLYFSDCIQTVRNGDEFVWSTAGANITVKARNVPISSKIEPSFKPLADRWRGREAQGKGTAGTESQSAT